MENVVEIILQVAVAVTLLYVVITVGNALKLASYHPEVMNEKAESKE